MSDQSNYNRPVAGKLILNFIIKNVIFYILLAILHPEVRHYYTALNSFSGIIYMAFMLIPIPFCGLLFLAFPLAIVIRYKRKYFFLFSILYFFCDYCIYIFLTSQDLKDINGLYYFLISFFVFIIVFRRKIFIRD